MKRTFVISLLLVSTAIYSQPLDNVLSSIEQNNPRLLAFRKLLEAEEIRAKTDIFPDDPIINYAYLFGSSSDIGNQQELEFSVRFRVPGYYLSLIDLRQLDLEQANKLAENERREIIHQASTVYFYLVWLRKMEELLKTRNEEAEKLAILLESAFQNSEISRQVYEKGTIFATKIYNEWQRTRSDIDIHTHKLEQLNGGLPFEGIIYDYPRLWEIPDWGSVATQIPLNNPTLALARLKVNQSLNDLKQQRLANWPIFELGYRSETILTQRLQGFQAGITIPLWQNTNKVRHASLNHEWAQVNLQQIENDVITEVFAIFSEVSTIKSNLERISEIIKGHHISAMNLQLLHKGQISFSDYIIEAAFIWESKKEFYELERTFFTKLSKLKSMI